MNILTLFEWNQVSLLTQGESTPPAFFFCVGKRLKCRILPLELLLYQWRLRFLCWPSRYDPRMFSSQWVCSILLHPFFCFLPLRLGTIFLLPCLGWRKLHYYSTLKCGWDWFYPLLGSACLEGRRLWLGRPSGHKLLLFFMRISMSIGNLCSKLSYFRGIQEDWTQFLRFWHPWFGS